ncbi:MAG: hypothetical protein SF123_07660 [Chloroflexota bacterium]|nr:hypothetical protein [Chloroflexota bacterium]
MVRYIYLGDRHTDPALHHMRCDPVRNARGKCIVGRGSALVVDADGRQHVVIRRRLRVVIAEQLPLFEGQNQPLFRR